MEKEMNKRDIVLFLGAGFSRDGVCLPLMSEFGEFSKSALRGIERHYKKKAREAAPMLFKAGNAFHEFQNFCLNNITLKKKDDINNLETIFCIAEALIESNKKEKRINNQKVSNIVKNIPIWLWKVYQQFPPWNENYSHRDKINQKVYFDFFEIIKKIAERLIVITTNYDLVFEHYSNQENIKCFYPIKNYKEISVTSSQKKYIFVGENNDKDAIALCKLHGSINFFSQNKNEDNKINIVNDLGDSLGIGKSGKWENKIALFALDSIWQLKQKYGKELIPAIIPPTYAKLTKKNWLREIWSRAFDAIVQAKKIIFIGYSFPESDGFMRALFHGAMSFRQGPPKVFVIDPCNSVHKRYRNFFNEAYIKIKPKKQTLEIAIKDTFKKIIS